MNPSDPYNQPQLPIVEAAPRQVPQPLYSPPVAGAYSPPLTPSILQGAQPAAPQLGQQNIVSPYRLPVTKSKTRKVMLGIAIFMVGGTLLLQGLSYAVVKAQEYVGYATIKPYDTARYHIDVPTAWRPTGREDKAHSSKIVFYDGELEAAQKATLRRASLTLNISKDLTVPVTQSAEQQMDNQKIVSRSADKLADALKCQQKNVLEDNNLSDAVHPYGHEVLIACAAKNGGHYVYGRYSLDSKGGLVAVLFTCRREVWQKNSAAVIKSINSIEVK